MVKLVLEYLNNEPPTSNRFASQAEKLNISTVELQLTVKALVLLIIETVKTKVTRTDFEETLFACLGPEQLQFFWEFINSQRQFIVNILRHYTVNDLRFRDLEWRHDARVASRCLLKQAVPTITMKLHLDAEEIEGNKLPLTSSASTDDDDGGGGGTDNDGATSSAREVLFQTDPTNLSHAIEVLELALDESKNHRTKNFVKSMQQQH